MPAQQQGLDLFSVQAFAQFAIAYRYFVDKGQKVA
jgi:hypothetical protein